MHNSEKQPAQSRMKLALLLFLTLTTFCLSSVDKRSEAKSKMKSVSGKEENEGLILVDDMWLDPDDLDWEGVGGREGRHGVKSKKRLWPKKKVPVTKVRSVLYYKISKEFDRDQRNEIQGAIEALEKELEQCVIFERLNVKSKKKDFVHVKPSKKTCSSAVGYRGKKQTIKLAPWCIKKRGSIMHEFMHALGAHHTHMRRDRDKYVKIYMRNIPEEKKKNYYKKSEGFSNYSLPYDFYSIMHYRDKRIQTRNKNDQRKIGQLQGLSKGDVELIKRMYKCK